jgi:hypothetical protein
LWQTISDPFDEIEISANMSRPFLFKRRHQVNCYKFYFILYVPWYAKPEAQEMRYTDHFQWIDKKRRLWSSYNNDRAEIDTSISLHTKRSMEKDKPKGKYEPTKFLFWKCSGFQRIKHMQSIFTLAR